MIEIECAPETSIAFWQTLGFTTVANLRGNGGGVYGFKILPRSFEVLAGAQKIAFEVSFYAEKRGATCCRCGAIAALGLYWMMVPSSCLNALSALSLTPSIIQTV